ncbi:MAG TPA: HlyD family efflux transporter periplasmic adaptor subunit [Acetobacteraceae bacterium]|jgi:HlyD family secretion protein|nr:HlyD family efflux transporter periplasmic adaptor subunit [Acetobacteraceae bacterium]
MDIANPQVFLNAMDRPITRRRLGHSALACGAVVLAGLAVAGWVTLHSPQSMVRLQASKITISTVATAPFHDFIPMRGEVVPLESIVLDAVLGGRVDEVYAEPGQRVSAGQPLLRLSDPSLELDVIGRETLVIQQINSQRAQQLNFEVLKTNDTKAVANAEYNIVRLSRELERRRPLVAKGYVSVEKLDQLTDELAYEKRLRGIALSALQNDATLIKQTDDVINENSGRLNENLAAARAQLRALTVRAPADGVLTSLDAHVGEEKTRGQHLGQLDRDGGTKVKAQVDEYYLARVKPGLPVSVTIDDKREALIVSKVYPQVKDRKFDVDLAWEGPMPHGLRRGQAVNGKLQLGDDAPAVVLPAGPFLEASGGNWVFVLDRGDAVKRPVRIGRRNAEAVEVLDGLQPGDRVITSDYTGMDHIDRISLSF